MKASKAWRPGRLVWVIGVLGSAFVAHADGGMPYVFENGTPARAEEVNANFAYLDERITNLEQGSDHVIHLSGSLSSSANGEALRQALDRLASTTTGRAKIVLGPGEFDLGEETLEIHQNVALEGAHRHLTTLKSSARTAIRLNLGSGLTSLKVDHSGSEIETTVLVEPRPEDGGGAFFRDVRFMATSQKELTVLKTRRGITVHLRNVWIEGTGQGKVVGVEVTGTGVMEAVGLSIKVRNNLAAGSATALLLDTIGRGHFFSSEFEATGQGKRLPMATGSNFSGTARFIGSRFVTLGDTFARIEGTGGKVYIGASELASKYYEVSGSTTVRCAQVFTSDYAEASGCFSELI